MSERKQAKKSIRTILHGKDYYSAPKYDVHIFTKSPYFVEISKKENYRLLSVNVDAPNTRLKSSKRWMCFNINNSEMLLNMQLPFQLIGIVQIGKRIRSIISEVTRPKGKGVQSLIITMGAKGVVIPHEGTFTHLPTVIVDAVDTTAAGDVFNGAFVVALCEGALITEALALACRAAAIRSRD